MNVQEYISSGIIESYVMGLASDADRREFEMMCKQHPEVLQARIDFEIMLEKQAFENAVNAPLQLKQKVLNAAFHSQPAKVVPISNAPVIRKANWFKYAAAASVILLAASLFWNYSLYSNNKKLKTDYTNTTVRLTAIEKDLRMIQQNPTVKMAALKGLDASPASFATVYWDTASKDVYLLVNNLPNPASTQQYQLWALLDGKPIDIGMIANEYFLKQETLLLRMKNVNGAQAFAITLEKKGGSPTPQGAMYVMGKL